MRLKFNPINRLKAKKLILLLLINIFMINIYSFGNNSSNELYLSNIAIAAIKTNTCAGSNNGTITLTVTNGTAPYTYMWNTGSTIQNLMGLSAGTYSVTVTDAIGNTASNSQVIGTNPNPTPIITGGPYGCNSVNLDAGAGYSTYSWSNGGHSETTAFNNPGTNAVSITVTDNNGCHGSASTIVNVFSSAPAEPGTISGNTLVCDNSTQVYSISTVNTAISYTWSFPPSWSGSSTSTSISLLVDNGNGNITIKANNTCGSSAVRTLGVTVNTIPSQPGSISGPATICQWSTQTYKVPQVTGATSYTWTLPVGWGGSSTVDSIVVNSADNGGQIKVTANNSCGSSSSTSMYITSASVPNTPGNIYGNTYVCSGTVQTYSVDPVDGASSYLWYIPMGWHGSSTTSTITTTAGSLNGNVLVIAVNNCGYSLSASVLGVNSNFAPILPDTIYGTTNPCAGTTQTYYVMPVMGATTYAWSLPNGWSGTSVSTSITVTVGNTAGNVRIKALNPCGSSLIQYLYVTPVAVTPVTIAGSPANLNFCAQIAPTSVNLTASSGFITYAWSPSGGHNQIATVNAVNTYTVVATNSGGCTSSAISNVTNNCAIVTGLSTTNILGTSATASWTQSQCGFNYTVRISRHNQNIWTNYNISPVSSFSFSGLSLSTQYDWQIKTNCNTMGSINSGWSSTQTFTTAAHRMEEEGNSGPSAFKIYPNPSTTQVNVSFSTQEEGNYTIYLNDMTGRIVKTEIDNAISGENTHVISLDGITKGIYMINIEKGQTSLKSKLVVD